MTAIPKARPVCMAGGGVSKLPTHAVHPRKTSIAVPINSARTASNLSRNVLSSSIFFNPEI